jgi:hypothetical protein
VALLLGHNLMALYQVLGLHLALLLPVHLARDLCSRR